MPGLACQLGSVWAPDGLASGWPCAWCMGSKNLCPDIVGCGRGGTTDGMGCAGWTGVGGATGGTFTGGVQGTSELDDP